MPRTRYRCGPLPGSGRCRAALCVIPVDPFSPPVRSIAVAQLGDVPIILGAASGKLRLWNLATGRRLGGSLAGHSGGVDSVALAKLDGHPIAISGGDDATVRVWDLARLSTRTGRFLHRLRLVRHRPWTASVHKDRVTAVGIGELHGQRVIISGSDDRTIRLRPLRDGPVLTVELDAAVVAVALAGRNLLVAATSQGLVVLAIDMDLRS